MRARREERKPSILIGLLWNLEVREEKGRGRVTKGKRKEEEGEGEEKIRNRRE